MLRMLCIAGWALIASTITMAQDGRLLLECSGFEDGDTEKVTVIQYDDFLQLTETMLDGSLNASTLPADQWERREIKISPIYQVYGRTLKLDEEGTWLIEFSCGETRPVDCGMPAH